MKTILLSVSVLCFLNSFSQKSNFPGGVYLSLEQLRSKTPAYEADLEVLKRAPADIAFNGGNDYRIESDVDSLKKKYMKKEIYAYAKNDSLFLNGFPHKLQTWYALALTSGNFLAFRGCVTNSELAIASAVVGALAASGKTYLYVLSLRTGNVRQLTKEYMIERLKEHPSLLTQFKEEKDQKSDATLLKYINLLNDIVDTSSK